MIYWAITTAKASIELQCKEEKEAVTHLISRKSHFKMETAHPRAYQKKTAGNIPHAMKFYTYYQQSLNKYLTLGQFLKVLSVCEGCFDLKRTLIHLDNKITTGCC